MTHQDISDEVTAQYLARHKALEQVRVTFNTKAKDVQAECEKIGHVIAGGVGTDTFDKYRGCVVCLARLPATPQATGVA